jgi:uroporphyrinogen-III decarboxylase
MTFKSSPGEMLGELMGPLVGLDKEWKAQGASPGELDLTAFGLDYVSVFMLGKTGAVNTMPEQALEDNDEYAVKRDGLGRTMKVIKKTATIPLPLDYPVKDKADWQQLKHMFEYDPLRVSREAIETAKVLQARGTMICASIPGGFDLPRDLMGEENACLCYYDEPDLMQDILDTVMNMSLRVFSDITEHVKIDCLYVHEDMAGKSGPLVGPALVDEFIAPYYRNIWDYLNGSGTRLFAQDSDGNMNPLIKSFIDCGVNVFYPCEPAAGMDIVALRKQYGKSIGLIGGIDKHVLRQSKDAIQQELEYKMQPLMLKGGVCFALDHRIPNGTPLENYKFYVKKAKEILGITGMELGWERFIL